MTPELLGEAVVDLMILSAIMGILCIGGIVSDYILPHIPPILRWLDSLPPYEDEN